MKFKDFHPDGATGGHSHNFFYRRFITGPQGAHYELLREPQHTLEDVQRAKAYIRRNFDVVSIRIVKETFTQPTAAVCN